MDGWKEEMAVTSDRGRNVFGVRKKVQVVRESGNGGDGEDDVLEGRGKVIREGRVVTWMAEDERGGQNSEDGKEELRPKGRNAKSGLCFTG